MYVCVPVCACVIASEIGTCFKRLSLPLSTNYVCSESKADSHRPVMQRTHISKQPGKQQTRDRTITGRNRVKAAHWNRS